MSWRNSAAPWPVSTTLVTFYFFYTMLFRGQDFFVSFALRRQLACGCFSLLPYRFLSNFKTEKYGPRKLETNKSHPSRRALSWNRWPLLFVFPSPLHMRYRFGLKTLNHISNLMFHIRSLKCYFSAVPQLPLLSIESFQAHIFALPY
jgi:hypothetical protein